MEPFSAATRLALPSSGLLVLSAPYVFHRDEAAGQGNRMKVVNHET